MYTPLGGIGSRLRKWSGVFIAATLLISALIAPSPAAAAETLIDETFDAQTDPANFGFPTGASIGNGVLNVTENMNNYTTSVREFSSSTLNESTLDLRFDWKTAIANDGMKTGLEFRDDSGRLVFAIAATASELRYAVTGPDSDSTTAPDSLNPTWMKTSFDRSKWYTVDLHMDFTVGTVQYSITSKEASPIVRASGTGSITGTNLAKFVACNYYGTGVQSIDNFTLDRPDHSAEGTLEGSSVYAFGDSIVRGHKYSRGFVDFVAEREGMALTKYAVNGATVGPVSGDSNGKILTQVRSASSAAPDFVVFDGSTNDAITLLETAGYDIGAVSASKDPTSFDTSTYTGSLETTIYEMQQKWPTAQLVYVPAHKLGSREWDIQLSLRQVNLDVAQKWDVAVADVFANSAFDTRIEDHRVAYTFDNLLNGYPGTNGSGTHPNIAGITEFYAPVLTAKLAELAGPVSGATYKLRNAATGEYLDSGSAGSLNTEAGTIYDDQDWILTRGSDGAWTIENVRSGRSYLDTEPNNVVKWNDGYIGPDTKWSVEPAPGGFRFNNEVSDRSYLHATSTGEVRWNTGATDDSTVWVLEQK
ncbi:GDSL-type esterase/lipase family protein [Glycomyces sp. L485]|uniref:RICIN domain-containing protein n=1 Tax=Glycomyces sp. L485 TaxID=2909235 RepID=UPI001F4A3A5E|nr:RICIN domain-containing protein [Glycomyces sp. L485]MCH7232265.1 GDSL-type esterase/lipase family protein [Glycomyces sp. L485]